LILSATAKGKFPSPFLLGAVAMSEIDRHNQAHKQAMEPWQECRIQRLNMSLKKSQVKTNLSFTKGHI
jgi:hypothetical protein